MEEVCKGRCFNEGEPSERVDVPVGLSRGTLQAALCKSLSESRTAASAAESSWEATREAFAGVREDAGVTFEHVLGDPEELFTRAREDAQGMMAKSAAALATAKDLLEKVHVTDAGADVEEALMKVAVPMTSEVGRTGEGIMSLSDCVIERIFQELDERVWNACYPPDVEVRPSSPREFAFSCSRFATLFRRSYVKKLFLNFALRCPERPARVFGSRQWRPGSLYCCVSGSNFWNRLCFSEFIR